MADLPKCLLEWERSLRRCQQEGRKTPDDEVKRLTLLKMLPPKPRAQIWANANQLYPTFRELRAKAQELITDNYDHKGAPMDIDAVDDDNGEGWKPTGQTLTGTNPDGEESLFLLQKEGN